MKKSIRSLSGRAVSAILALSLSAAFLTGCSASQDSGLTPVTLNEVAHSIFYAPQYAAIELGYFEDEGIALTLVNGGGADKVMTALISADADIGFMGSQAGIYAYQEGSQDYAVYFAQLTQRAGNFLVSRTPKEDFQWTDLKGTSVLGGRAGGRPITRNSVSQIPSSHPGQAPAVLSPSLDSPGKVPKNSLTKFRKTDIITNF